MSQADEVRIPVTKWFRETVIKRREQSGKSQAQVAVEAGFPPCFISNVEVGRNLTVSKERYELLCMALGMDPDATSRAMERNRTPEETRGERAAKRSNGDKPVVQSGNDDLNVIAAIRFLASKGIDGDCFDVLTRVFKGGNK